MAGPRDPDLWLRDLKKAQADAAAGLRPKVTILEVADLSESTDPSVKLEPSSPRSVEAFLQLGIDPADLRRIPLEVFLAREPVPDLAQLLFTAAEKLRQERLHMLTEERQRLVDASAQGTAGGQGGNGKAGGASAGSGSEMIDLEAARLDVLRRRQEREMEQMREYEETRKAIRDKAEAKVAQMEARAEAQRKAKQAADAAWRKAQRERELQRAQDEVTREKEAKAMEVERHRREKELYDKAAEAEKQRLREAYEREQERIQKAEQARMETERILAEQQAGVAAKKAEMLKRDAEKDKKKAEQAAERAAANEEARKRATERIASALHSNKEILLKRRADFNSKQAENENRRRQKEAEREAEEAAARQAEAEAARQRREAYEGACRIEEQRIQNLVSKKEAKDEKLGMLYDQRNHENRRRALMRELELKDKKNKVEEKQRQDAWKRSQLLQKIKGDTEKTRSLKEQREFLQQQRRQANMEASFQRQKLVASYQQGAQKA